MYWYKHLQIIRKFVMWEVFRTIERPREKSTSRTINLTRRSQSIKIKDLGLKSVLFLKTKNAVIDFKSSFYITMHIYLDKVQIENFNMFLSLLLKWETSFCSLTSMFCKMLIKWQTKFLSQTERIRTCSLIFFVTHRPANQW